MVLNAAVQMLREAEELKQNILKLNNGTSMLQDKSLWTTQQQLQKVYQKVLVLDLDYALEKKVEQDLWNVGFKQQIEALQAISKDRKNQLRTEAQAMLSWVLQAAAGFYLCLLHQICTTFKLDLPFRRRTSFLGAVEGWDASPAVGKVSADAGAARYACQHCLVHLGDLARYRQQLRVAHTFYRHALAVSVHSGQPYNQLALVSWRRGRRLAAVYWHVRSLLVRAPFPPAPANLARTLAAAACRDVKEATPLPVLPGITPTTTTVSIQERLDSHTYVNELVRVVHYLHTVDQLDMASELVNTLNTSLSPLIATDSFDSMTLIKMACVLIWLTHSTTEDFSLEESSLSCGEGQAMMLTHSLCAAVLLALLLPAYTVDELPQRPLPALKVWLEWIVLHPKVVSSTAWSTRPQLWTALAHVFNKLTPISKDYIDKYDTVPLPEDEELNGFLPLEEALTGLKFNNTSWDPNKLPDAEPADDDMGSTGVSSLSLIGEPELEQRVRGVRLLRLAQRLADLFPDHITCTTTEEGTLSFSAQAVCGAQLSAALAQLSSAQGPADAAPPPPPPPPPPVIISEADFREKVREKRVGILKPQGSLERAREERALAITLEEPELEIPEETNKIEDKGKAERKPRVNIAMAAIMRKQEESNKQVKFITPPPIPDSPSETPEITTKEEKPKVIQPKPIKSLANIPVGRKTGGILSLKDKSAGYPHLQNTDPEPKKPEKEEKKEPKPSQTSPNSQNFQKRDQANNWPNLPAQNYDSQRINFQKNYGIQNTGISYNPNYQTSNNQGIKLPVVNPKEIDVRTAALQKQNSRQELFQDGHKFNHGYQISGDKKHFLNDLPPRFANQYRYWQNTQENQFENKFRDDSINTNLPFNVNQQRPNWPPNDYQQQWWKPENQPNFNPQNFTNPQINMPNLYSALPTNMTNPYNLQFNQNVPNLGQNMPNLGQNINSMGQNMSNVGQNIPNLGQNMPNLGQNISNMGQNIPNMGQNIPSMGQSIPNLGQNMPNKDTLTPNYPQPTIGQPQIQTLQNLVTSPNFNSTLNSFGPYNPTVSYDSSMYPHFSNYHQVKMEKPFQGQAKEDVGFGSNVSDVQRNINYETFADGAMKTLDNVGQGAAPLQASAGEASTYSLFSGAPDAAAWPRHHQQSLWSGPGPSPLERLLEQQKQMKP